MSVSDLELELFLVSDLPPERAAAVQAAIDSDARLAALVDARRAAQRVFRAPPLPASPASFGDRLRAWFDAVPRAAWLAPAAAAMLLVVVVARDPGADPAAAPGEPVVRTRGSLAVEVVVERAGRPFLLQPGALLRPGDRLQVTLQLPRAGFLTVVEQDDDGGRGVVHEGLAVQAGPFMLPESLELDEHVGLEELAFVLAPRPVPAADVHAALRSRADLPFDSARVAFEVEAPP